MRISSLGISLGFGWNWDNISINKRLKRIHYALSEHRLFAINIMMVDLNIMISLTLGQIGNFHMAMDLGNI